MGRMDFAIFNMILYNFISVMFILFDGTMKKGWQRILQEFFRSFFFSLYFLAGFYVIVFIYPIFPDYWKIIGTGFCMILTLIFPCISMWIGSSINDARKNILFSYGWRESEIDDYSNLDEYFEKHWNQLSHKEYGLCNDGINGAEKIMKKNKVVGF